MSTALRLSICLAALGCGDHLVDRDFEGDVVFSQPGFSISMGPGAGAFTRRTTVYNLSVSGPRNYYAAGVLVHNY